VTAPTSARAQGNEFAYVASLSLNNSRGSAAQFPLILRNKRSSMGFRLEAPDRKTQPRPARVS
jgi:hypothetical protein